MPLHFTWHVLSVTVHPSSYILFSILIISKTLNTQAYHFSRFAVRVPFLNSILMPYFYSYIFLWCGCNSLAWCIASCSYTTSWLIIECYAFIFTIFRYYTFGSCLIEILERCRSFRYDITKAIWRWSLVWICGNFFDIFLNWISWKQSNFVMLL